MGSSKKQTVGYKYYLGMHMIMCHGPVDKVTQVKVDNKVAWSGNSTGGSIYVNSPNLFGGEEREGGVQGTVDIEMGRTDQGRNTYLQSQLGTAIPAFRRVLGLVLRQCYLGNNPYLKRWVIRATRIHVRQDGLAQWYDAKAEIGGDMNPAHIVREVLTDPDWGMGYNESDVDDTSFASAADTLYSEGMGMSLLWDKQQQLSDFLATVLRHVDGSLYVDRTTGKFVLKLARGGYDLSTLPVLDEQSIDRVTDFKRSTVAELTNQVSVTYWDKTTGKNNSVTVQDIALTAQQGATVGTTVQYPGFTKGAIASRVASRDLKALSTPLASATLYVNRKAATFNIGDVFKFSWEEYGVSQLVMRVTNIELGELTNNMVKVSAIEDVFALGSAIYAPPPPSEWENPFGAPTAMAHRVLTESPYYLLARGLGDSQAAALEPTATYVLVGGAKPGGGAISAQVYIDEGAGYVQQGVVNFAPTAVLQATYGPGDTVLSIAGGADLDLVEPGDIGTFGVGASNAREWFQVVSVSDTVLTVKRGMLDTVPLPSLASGTRVLFYGEGDYLTDVPVEYALGEAVSARMLPTTGQGTLDLASAPTDTLTMVARQSKPYPPGQLRLNGASYPVSISGPLVVTWAHRDRLQQTAQALIDQGAASVGPEAGTTYTLRLYGNGDVLRRTVTGLTGTSYSWTTESADSGLAAGDSALLHFNGVAGSTVFTDESGKAWTAAGNAQLTATGPKFGSACLLLDGTGDYVYTPAHADFQFGAGTLTVECFANFAVALSSCGLVSQWGVSGSQTSFALWMNAGKLCFRFWDGSAYRDTEATWTPAVDTWYHLAATRDASGVVRVFVDGAVLTSATFAQTIAVSSSNVVIGAVDGFSLDFNGKIDEVRVSKECKYSAPFTPPASELTHRPPQLNTFVRVELESVRDGLTSLFKHNYATTR